MSSMQFRYPSAHERFDYDSWPEVEARLSALDLSLPYTESVAALSRPVVAGPLQVPNAIAIHPMEGCDADENGAPGELTFRRYRRFAAGGAGLIWGEAASVLPEGRANPRQLWLHEGTVEQFAQLHETIITTAAAKFGTAHRPITVLQLTHSGRYARPDGLPRPVIAHHNPVLDARLGLPEDYPLISDAQLEALTEPFVAAARLARQAGFDAVDLKACHGYLLNELLAAHTRGDSLFGGTFENRTRLLLHLVEQIHQHVPDLALTCRLNVYDAFAYPYGFGMAHDGSLEPDLDEPVELICRLHEAGVSLVNVAYGNPYYNPHVERPYDSHEVGGYMPHEHPLANVAAMVRIQQELSRRLPQVPMVATGLTWLRQFGPNVAAAMVEQNWCAVAGFGRMALAYPEFAADLLSNGQLSTDRVCVSCSRCTQIMRDGGQAGCVVRDAGVYGPIYRAGRQRARETTQDK
ncbi:MAG: flavin oxidoreductase/NADH oxidase [candidate division WS1 bacterium]|nr:flavin oxidoreductase/NADH oxidase [candidate division WS1 bacterium]